MASPIIPPQSAAVPPCPVCNRPIYPDIEHNPLCPAIANLQSLVYKAAGTLEVDQAERWADLHQRMTKLHGETPEEVKEHLAKLEERVAELERTVWPPAKRGSSDEPEKTGEEKKPEQESGSANVAQ